MHHKALTKALLLIVGIGLGANSCGKDFYRSKQSGAGNIDDLSARDQTFIPASPIPEAPLGTLIIPVEEAHRIEAKVAYIFVYDAVTGEIVSREKKEVVDEPPRVSLKKGGAYRVRVVYLDDDDNLIYDSRKCENVNTSSIVDLDSDEKTIEVSGCPEDQAATPDSPLISERDRILNPNFHSAGWPLRPRRSATIDDKSIQTNILEMSLNVGRWGGALAGAKKTKVGTSYSSSVMIVKHAPNGTTNLFGSDNSLNVEEGITFVALCVYQGSIDRSVENSNAVSIKPDVPFIPIQGEVKVSRERNKSQVLSISASSKFFEVRKNETIIQLQNRCKDIFDATVKETVDRDLNNLAKIYLQKDERDNPLEVIDAAIFGPTRSLRANGVDWEVHEAKISKKDPSLFVVGTLTRIQKTSEFWGIVKKTKTHPIHYRLELGEKGKILSEAYTDSKNKARNPNEPWVQRGIQIIKDIGRAAWAGR